jgi:hypothetical protein
MAIIINMAMVMNMAARSHLYGNAFLVGCEAGVSIDKSSMMAVI